MNKQPNSYIRKIKQIYHRVSRRALFRLHGMLHDTVTISTKQGILTVSTKDEMIGASLYRDKQYEFDSSINAIKFLKQSGFISEGKVSMFDIGANIGLISTGLLLANEVDVVIAIEPVSQNFELLRKNVDQNGLSQRVVCLQAAVGDKASTLEMELSLTNKGDHRIRSTIAPSASERMGESTRETIQVPSLTLPQITELPEVQKLGLSLPSVIWIDIQGYEGFVFKGGRSVLEKGIPTVSEIWPYGILRSGMSLEEFVNLVSSIWSDYWVERRGTYIRYPITVFDRYLDEIGSSDERYYENVIFTKEST